MTHAVLTLGLISSGACFRLQAASGETVQIGQGTGLVLGARYFKPSGPGPFPAILVLHGVGGLWANDNPAGGVMSLHFEEWAQTFTDLGYAALFMDSFTARGIVEFQSRRPAESPTVDDSICSPAYERPKDVYKALAFLQSRPEVRADRIGLLGFSHGAETSLASLLSATVTKTTWSVSYLKTNGTTTNLVVPAPVRLTNPPGFRVAVVYYPGCGFYNYFGSPSSTASNLYMPYAPTLIQHGSADPLYADNLYPEKMVLKSDSHAKSLGLNFNPMQILVYTNATHSFDEAVLNPTPAGENANQSARRAAREVTIRWFEACLKDSTLGISRTGPGMVRLRWPSAAGVSFSLTSGTDPQFPAGATQMFQGTQTGTDFTLDIPAEGPMKFFRLGRGPATTF